MDTDGHKSTQVDSSGHKLTHVDNCGQKWTLVDTSGHNLTQLNLRSYAQIVCLFKEVFQPFVHLSGVLLSKILSIDQKTQQIY